MNVLVKNSSGDIPVKSLEEKSDGMTARILTQSLDGTTNRVGLHVEKMVIGISTALVLVDNFTI